MKMKRAFKMWLVTFSLVIMTTITLGVVAAKDHMTIENQETITRVEKEEAAPIVISSEQPSQSVEDSLKICKDSQGNVKACDDSDFLLLLVASIGGVKGASALTIAFLISKLLLLLLLSPFFTNMFPSLLKGGVKLLVASGLNVVVGVLSLMAPPVNLPFSAAIVHASVLALASVFANQAFKQWLTKKGQS